MSSGKKDFIAIIPDKPGAQAKRLEVRPQHIEGLKPWIENGTFTSGGATMQRHPGPGETPTFTGSMVTALVESEQELREILSKDVYATSGVWDVEKAQIIPFKFAVRSPL